VRDAETWTFMVFMDGDNNLEPLAIEDFNELESVGSTANVNIIVQIDRHPRYDSTNGDWADTRRYFIEKDTDNYQITSTLIEDMGEVNMADPTSLEEFLNWGMMNYTADHYFLSIWNHGSGLFRSSSSSGSNIEADTDTAAAGADADLGTDTRGFLSDTTNGGEMKLWELDNVLNTIKTQYSQRIDIVAFDVCFLGYLEAAYEIADSVDFFIGSADEVPDDGLEYDDILEVLTANPSITPREYATTVAQNYIDEYAANTHYITYLAMDLARLNSTFVPLLDTFATKLYHEMYYYENEIKAARSSAVHRNIPDLWGFTNTISQTPELPGTLLDAADVLLTEFETTVLAHGEGSSHSNSHSMGVHFPTYGPSYSYSKLDFSAHYWDEFLEMFANPRETAIHITHTPLIDTENTQDPITFTAQVNGENLDTDSVTLHYHIDGAIETTNMLYSPVTGLYSASILPQPNGTTVGYYLSARDLVGNATLLPVETQVDDPTTFYSFSIRADTIPPTITHEPLSDTLDFSNPYLITIIATDNIGINEDNCLLHYRVNGSTFDTVQLEKCNAVDHGGQFTGEIPAQATGSVIEYYLEVTDTATLPNVARAPLSGHFKFNITIPDATILIDYSHQNPLLDYTYSSNDIKNQYFQVNYSTTQLTDVIFDTFDVFLSIAPRTNPTTEEQAALERFVADGGSFFFIGGENRTLNSQYTAFSGLVWREATGGSKTLTALTAHPVTEYLDGVYTGEYSALPTPVGANALGLIADRNVSDPGAELAVAAAQYGMGKVVAVADNILDNNHIASANNTDLGKNIIRWLITNLAPKPVVADIIVEKGATGTLDASQSFDPDGAVVEYKWIIDSQGVEFGPAISLLFTDAGRDQIQLIITDNDGVTAQTIVNITINTPPTVLGWVPEVTDRFIPTYLRSDSFDVDGYIANTTWELDNNTVLYGPNVTHHFSSIGVHSVTLKITDNLGSFRMETYPTELRNYRPTAMISSLSEELVLEEYSNRTPSIKENTMVVLSGEGSFDLDGPGGSGNVTSYDRFPVSSYHWKFDDGTEATGAIVNHTFTSRGFQSVILTVTDADNAVGRDSIDIFL